MRWKFKRTKPDVAVKLEPGVDWSERFFANPVASNAKRIAEEVKNLPTGEWPTVAVLGRYIAGYENRFKRAWPAGPVALRDAIKRIATLVQRDGAEGACAAVDAVFSTHLRWVSGDLLGFLLNETNYVRFVIPAMAKVTETRTKHAGEQAEWSGTRTENGTYEEVSL